MPRSKDGEIFKEFKSAKEVDSPESLEELSEEELKHLEFLGLGGSLPKEGEFLQVDGKALVCKKEVEGLEILPIKEALSKYEWAKKYYWKLLSPKRDSVTRVAYEDLDDGYFVRVLPGQKLVYPVQACLYIHTEKISQKVHNIVIVEEGAELNLITSCAVAPHVNSAFHIGVSEYYIKKNAKLTFTMLHAWTSATIVRPKTGVLIEEGGTFISTYVSLFPVKSIKSFPTCRLVGSGAKASLISIIVNHPGSHVDVGGEVILEKEGTRADIVSRTVIYGGENIAKSRIVAKAPKVKGHLECQGLMLSDDGIMQAIPELTSYYSDVELTHEAAVGKIAREEVEYLMARGLSEDEAVSLIVKGFLSVKVEGISPELQKEIDKAVSLAGGGF